MFQVFFFFIIIRSMRIYVYDDIDSCFSGNDARTKHNSITSKYDNIIKIIIDKYNFANNSKSAHNNSNASHLVRNLVQLLLFAVECCPCVCCVVVLGA